MDLKTAKNTTKKRLLVTAYYVTWVICFFVFRRYDVFNNANIILLMIPGLTLVGLLSS